MSPVCGADLLGEPALGVAVGDEADVVGVGLLRDREPATRGLFAHERLRRRVAEREVGVRELLCREHAEHVALVFRLGARTVQLAVAVGVFDDLRVVAGGDGVEPERERLLEQGGELDALVAAHARVRRAAGRVLGDEVVDDIGLEPLGEVPHVIGNAEHVGGALRVHGVFDRAAAAAAGAQGARVAAEREVHADHFMPGFDGARGSDGAVDAAAHRCENLHPSSLGRLLSGCPVPFAALRGCR